MKYYSLKFKRDLDGWGGKAKMWKIQILEKYRHDKGLLEHEKFHVRCWWYCLAATWMVALAMFFAGTDGLWLPVMVMGPWMHGMLYRNKYFRMMAEVQAYKIQLRVGSYASNRFAAKSLANKYRLGLSEEDAAKKLGI